MCVKKLRDIDDPETVLCRAVLINNTFRTLKTAQRQLLRNARRKIEQQESSDDDESEEEEEIEEEASDNKTVEVEESYENREPPLLSLNSDHLLDDIEDIPCPDSTMVHSLIMPPLLPPHIEDMTNCSFYDTFGPVVDCGAQQGQDSVENVAASIKLTICGVIQENNSNTNVTNTPSVTNITSNSQNGFHLQKSEFGGSCGSQSGCGTQGEDALLDNLLTEIAQA